MVAEGNAVIGLMKVIALSHWTQRTRVHMCAAALESKKPEGLSLAVHHNMMRQHIAGQVVFLHTRMGCV